ncbi:glycosyl hydrolase [Bacillus sp. HMF5848]|uniref:putative glycoside hydrolase n=1 Tax=Bacillus sp. HMF5848 TaxID=2495421 RepID=UPI000F79C0E6|nr:putative glycoside hydrolase [Bacillus sp. HMF5848]RSK28320.1 glycosyl hydrolase [Bacillus sp. HMF5848]
MFSKKVVIMLTTLLMLLSTVHMGVQAMQTHPLQDIQTYKVYYDEPTKRVIKQMNRYDVVIVEPLYYTKELVDEIQSQGVKLYAYVSVMESDSWNNNRMSKIEETDYFYKNGEKVHFEKWDSYLMDLSSEHYQDVLFNEVNEQVIEKGFTGIFFDTAGDIDDQFYYTDQIEYVKQAESYVQLLERVTEQFEDVSIIQNWGIHLFREYSHQYVDAIMWEGFDSQVVSKDQWSLDRIQELKELQKTHDFQVLTLSFNNGKQSKKFSNSNQFIHYHEKNHFNKW